MSFYVLDYRIAGYLDSVQHRLTYDYNTYLDKMGNKHSKLRVENVRKSVGCVLYNAIRSLRFNVTEESVVLDANIFSKTRVVNGRTINRKVPYKTFRPLLDWLVNNEYIELERGGIESWVIDPITQKFVPDELSASQIRYTEKFIKLMEEPLQVQSEETLENVIVMRNKDHKEIQFKMTDELKKAKSLLDSYNKLALNINFRVKDSDKFLKVQGYKVYNSSSDQHGGRTYLEGGSIQTMKAIDRKSILIDDEECVEYDFSALHPSLLCEMIRFQMPDDFKPYGIKLDGYDADILRKIAKQALLIMINTSSKQQAQSALRLWVRNNFDVETLHSEGKVPFTIDTCQILDKLFQHNHMIRDFLCNEFSSGLQNTDSKIMDHILDHYATRNIVVIPIHDSIIIQKRYEDTAVKVMTEAYRAVMGDVLNCRVEKK